MITATTTTNAAIDTPTASATTLSSSSSAPAVDSLVIYSLGTISGPSSYNIISKYSGVLLNIKNKYEFSPKYLWEKFDELSNLSN